MKIRQRIAAAALVACSPLGAHAQGIPVIDIANLLQTLMQVMNDITEISNQVQQIEQLQDQLRSLNGMRNLGDVFDNPALRNYVPVDAYRNLEAAARRGYDGMTETARALRRDGMVYNCENLREEQRSQCETVLSLPYQHKGLLQDAMQAASGRLSQITSLMRQVNATSDQKAVQEIQARIGAENALLSHEVSQIQMLVGMADSDERIERSRDRERQYQQLQRSGKVANFLP